MFRRSWSDGTLELKHGLPGFRGEGDALETEHPRGSHGDVTIGRSRGYTVRSLLLAPRLEIATDVEQILRIVSLEGGSGWEGNLSETFED